MNQYMSKVLILVDRLRGSALFKDSFWALIGSAAGKGLSLIAGIAIARFLGSEVYGEYGTIKNTLMMIAIFSSMGLGYSATKFIAESRTSNDHKRVFDTHKIASILTYIMSGCIALLVIIGAGQIAIWLEAPHLSSALRFSAIAIIFNAVNTTQAGELAGFGAYKELARNNTIAGIITFFTSVLLTYFYNFDGAIIALIISLFFNAVLNRITIGKCIANKDNAGKIDKAYIKEIIKFSIPIALQEGLYSVTHWGTIIIMVKLANYTEIGLSSAANQWMAVILFIPGALRNVALTHLSASNNDQKRNRDILKRLLAINFVSTFVPFMVISALSGWIESWYGDSFDGLQAVLNVCVFTAIVNSQTNVLTQEYMAHGKNWFLFFSRLIRDIGILVSLYIALQTFGHGALTSAIVTLLWQLGYLVVLLAKLTKQ